MERAEKNSLQYLGDTQISSMFVGNMPESVAYLSGLVTLEPGDLIYTGTPEGVGAVNRGEEIIVHVDGVCDLTLKIA